MRTDVDQLVGELSAAGIAHATRLGLLLKPSLETEAWRPKRSPPQLIAEGIAPRSLLPPEYSDSPLERIRKAYRWQMKLVPEASQQTLSVPDIRPSVTGRPTQGHGPKMTM